MPAVRPGNGAAAGRFLLVFAILCALGLATYFIGDAAMQEAAAFVTMLFVLPFTIGGLATLMTGQFGQPKATVIVPLTLGVLIVGGVVLREGMVCIAMLAVPWFFGALFGVLAVKGWRRAATRAAGAVRTFSLGVLPLIGLATEPLLPVTQETVTVTRSVAIDASAAEVWPVLLAMDAISEAEGRWTFAQSILRVPRPTSAVVVGEGPGARRLAEWGGRARFEEVVTDWQPGRAMAWRFRFPDDSIQRYTDRHISPEGPIVRIERGGYALTPDGAGGTVLTLTTTYRIETPLNWYGKLWGEVLLGDVQANVLRIVADRAEETMR